MAHTDALARPEIQVELIAEALRSANVGFLVWDEDRRYIAANECACEILGTTLEELLGQEVGSHTVAGGESLERGEIPPFAQGRAVVERFDGSGRVEVFHATFTTRTAGMPFMATIIAPVEA